jgi:hypothetical protein
MFIYKIKNLPSMLLTLLIVIISIQIVHLMSRISFESICLILIRNLCYFVLVLMIITVFFFIEGNSSSFVMIKVGSSIFHVIQCFHF